MNRESRLVLEVWEATRDFIPVVKRADVALTLLRSFEEFGIDPGDFVDLKGEDKHLEEAFQTLYGDDPEAEYEDDVDGDDGYEN
jgi:hypothetical protein